MQLIIEDIEGFEITRLPTTGYHLWAELRIKCLGCGKQYGIPVLLPVDYAGTSEFDVSDCRRDIHGDCEACGTKFRIKAKWSE
jgi:hypothetical protein